MSSPIYPLPSPSAHSFHKELFPRPSGPSDERLLHAVFRVFYLGKGKHLLPSNTYDRYSNLRCSSSNDTTLVGDGSRPGLVCILSSVALRRVSFSGWRFPLASNGRHQSLCSTEVYCSMFWRRSIRTGEPDWNATSAKTSTMWRVHVCVDFYGHFFFHIDEINMFAYRNAHNFHRHPLSSGNDVHMSYLSMSSNKILHVT